MCIVLFVLRYNFTDIYLAFELFMEQVVCFEIKCDFTQLRQRPFDFYVVMGDMRGREDVFGPGI